MPIYAYRCQECGFAKDVLQKVSDAPLTECPSCGKSSFKKQLTAAGFQLKGTGWYVTDFRGGNNSASSSGTGGASSASSSGNNTGSSSDSGSAAASDTASSSSSSSTAA